MNRRELLTRVSVIMGGTLTPALTRALAAERSPQADASALTSVQRALAGALAETIIPATDTPGALAAGVDEYIDRALVAFFSSEERDDYIRGLELFAKYAEHETGKAFPALDDQSRHRLVLALDQAAFATTTAEPSVLQAFYRTHKGLTITGYYTSEAGQTQELHLPPMGTFDADVPVAEIGRTWA